MSAAGVKRARSQSLSPEEQDIRIQNIAYLIKVSLEAFNPKPIQTQEKELEYVTSDASRT